MLTMYGPHTRHIWSGYIVCSLCMVLILAIYGQDTYMLIVWSSYSPYMVRIHSMLTMYGPHTRHIWSGYIVCSLCMVLILAIYGQDT